ncbi:unnamed protein product [Rotaria magnacalcarata]
MSLYTTGAVTMNSMPKKAPSTMPQITDVMSLQTTSIHSTTISTVAALSMMESTKVNTVVSTMLMSGLKSNTMPITNRDADYTTVNEVGTSSYVNPMTTIEVTAGNTVTSNAGCSLTQSGS